MAFSEYYKKEIARYGGVNKYIFAKAKEKQPLLKRVEKYAYNKKIIETGAGSSSNSIYLANRGYSVVCLDLDQNIISLAKMISSKFKKQPKYLNENMLNFNEKDFSVCFNHGVMEHFSNKEIINLVNKQLEIAKYFIFSVPSNFFRKNQAINGDERFLSVKKWREILSHSKGEILEEFDYFYDPDNLRLKVLKLLSKLTLGVLPIKKPYIGFVLKKHVHNS